MAENQQQQLPDGPDGPRTVRGINAFLQQLGAVSGTTAHHAAIYDALEAGGWYTERFLGSETIFRDEILPCLADVISGVPEPRRAAFRRALIVASADLQTEQLAAVPAAASGGASAAGDRSTTTGVAPVLGEEGESDPKGARSSTISFVTPDNQKIYVQKREGTFDRINASLHWLRMLDHERRNALLGRNIEISHEEFRGTLLGLKRKAQAGVGLTVGDWSSLDRYDELKGNRVMLAPEKFTRFVAFEWDAYHPGRLSITDFLPRNTVVDERDLLSFEAQDRSALRRAVEDVGITFHVITGAPEGDYTWAFQPLTDLLKGEVTSHLSVPFLCYVINLVMEKVCYSFRQEAPTAAEPRRFIKEGAFPQELRKAVDAMVKGLPTTTDSTGLQKFNRDIFHELEFSGRLRANSASSTSSGDTAEVGMKRSASSGSSSTPSKRGKTSGGSAVTPKVEPLRPIIRQEQGGATKNGTTAGGSTPEAQPAPCPFNLAGLLGITGLKDGKLVSCRNGKGCKRGSHGPLSQFTRTKATSAFTSGNIQGNVPEKALAILKDRPAGDFRSVTIGKND